jgi:hypothetical protein
MPGNRAAQSTIDEPWCVTQHPTRHQQPSTTRAHFTITRTPDQHPHLDTTPLLQECRSALAVIRERDASRVNVRDAACNQGFELEERPLPGQWV